MTYPTIHVRLTCISSILHNAITAQVMFHYKICKCVIKVFNIKVIFTTSCVYVQYVTSKIYVQVIHAYTKLIMNVYIT